MKRDHARIEAIAGAIALNEATDAERAEYRRHLAGCEPCARELGGEFEIARVAATVAGARDAELWRPSVPRSRRAATARRAAVAICAAFAVAAAGAGAFSGLHRAHPTALAKPAARAFPRLAAVAAPAPQRRLIVEHYVVQMVRAPAAVAAASAAIRHATAPHAARSQIDEVTVHPDAAIGGDPNVPIWRRGDPQWRTVTRSTTTSLTETAPSSMSEHAESLQFTYAPDTHEAAPVGGETAINPQPPMIAYDEGAYGTAAFEVFVDARGVPTHCAITQSSGYLVLDVTVCKAAMQARYTPKTVNGRPVAGTYRDAFTFRNDD